MLLKRSRKKTLFGISVVAVRLTNQFRTSPMYAFGTCTSKAENNCLPCISSTAPSSERSNSVYTVVFAPTHTPPEKSAFSIYLLPGSDAGKSPPYTSEADFPFPFFKALISKSKLSTQLQPYLRNLYQFCLYGGICAHSHSSREICIFDLSPSG